MQVVNNSNQPNFTSVKYNLLGLKSVEKEVKNVLYSKLPKEEVDKFLKENH